MTRPSKPGEADDASSLVVPMIVLSGQVLLPQSAVPFPRARLQRKQFGRLPENSVDLFLAVPERTSCWKPSPYKIEQPEASGIGCLMRIESRGHSDEAAELIMVRGIGRARYQPLEIVATPCPRPAESRVDAVCLHRSGEDGLQTAPPLRRSHSSSHDRLVAIEPLPDDDEFLSEEDITGLRQQLIQHLLSRCPDLAIREMSGLLECELPLGHLCDLAAPALGLSLQQLREILGEHRVIARCRSLLCMAADARPAPAGAIPDFGEN